MRGDDHRVEAERERGVGGVERRHPAVAEREAEPRMPGPGPHSATSQRVGSRGQRLGRRDRLVLAAVGRARGDVAAEQPARAQVLTTRESAAGQRAARRLDVADAAARARAWASAHAIGASWPCRKNTPGDRERRAVLALEVALLDRPDRVLERSCS